MYLIRLAQLMSLKYSIAEGVDNVEASLRHKISSLWMVPNKTHNVLRVCADAIDRIHIPEDKEGVLEEPLEISGNRFCKQLINLIDALKANQDKMSLGKIREVVLTLINLINDNKGDEKVQFPHVSELIFKLFSSGKKHDRKLRDEQYGKAKTGLARILSIALSMMDDLNKLEVMVPEKFTYKGKEDINQPLPGRFEPQRAPLSEYDIVDFIRQHGSEYGISSQEDWGVAVRNDPQLREQLTTVINALNRGHYPRDAADVKMQIAEIMHDYEARKQLNPEVAVPLKFRDLPVKDEQKSEETQ